MCACALVTVHDIIVKYDGVTQTRHATTVMQIDSEGKLPIFTIFHD